MRLGLRAKWVVADKEKFTVLLGDLKDYNDGLEQLFPPARLEMLQRTWRYVAFCLVLLMK